MNAQQAGLMQMQLRHNAEDLQGYLNLYLELYGILNHVETDQTVFNKFRSYHKVVTGLLEHVCQTHLMSIL